jgi:hypothetical protein
MICNEFKHGTTVLTQKSTLNECREKPDLNQICFKNHDYINPDFETFSDGSDDRKHVHVKYVYFLNISC